MAQDRKRAGCCEHGDETSLSIKGSEFPDQLSDCNSCHSGRPLTEETRIRYQTTPYGSGQSATGAGFSPSISVFPCQHFFTLAPYAY